MDPIAKYNAIVVAAQFNRPSLDILHELVHVFLEEIIPKNKLYFGTARLLDQRPLLLTDPDTFVQAEIEPDYDYRFPGENGFLYRRIPVTAWVGNALELMAPEFPFTTYDVLEQINRKYSLQLSEDDVVNTEYDFGDSLFTLQMHPESYCWFGTRVLPMNFSGIPNNGRVTHDGGVRITSGGGVRVIEPPR